MPAAVLFDQRRGRNAGADLIDEWLTALNMDPDVSLVRPFDRTAGDETEGLVSARASRQARPFDSSASITANDSICCRPP
jgi:hypothetical protein